MVTSELPFVVSYALGARTCWGEYCWSYSESFGVSNACIWTSYSTYRNSSFRSNASLTFSAAGFGTSIEMKPSSSERRYISAFPGVSDWTSASAVDIEVVFAIPKLSRTFSTPSAETVVVTVAAAPAAAVVFRKVRRAQEWLSSPVMTQNSTGHHRTYIYLISL